jgi:broad specificity phosphatase PhoE
VTTRIAFETHSISEDNELGLASGWTHGPLAPRGRELARELGERRRDDGIDTVFVSDLHRAIETAVLAFEGETMPILFDWRLRECDYGALTRQPAAEVHDARLSYLDSPYPGGESWRQAIARVGRFLDDLPTRWDGTRVLVIGHVATRWGLEHFCNGVPLEALAAAEFEWQEGWEYETPGPADGRA